MGFVKTPVKGMCDILPSEMRLREKVLYMIKDSYSKFGFELIETPVMEHIENLCSKQGGENEKLIFKVMKRGAELVRALEKNDELADSGLRYDLTVPLVRYYSNNAENLITPFKALQIGNVFRADNPQKGRFRQFMQCDIDILGDATSFAEIELISATTNMLSTIFALVGLDKFTVHVNDRRILIAIAKWAGFSEEDVPNVLISLDKLDKVGLDGVKAELLEKEYGEAVINKYLNIYSSIKEGITVEEFCKDVDMDNAVINSLKEIIMCATESVSKNVTIAFDPTLVRGMGYYTGTIFEVSVDGYNFAIAGGGRYDKMVGKFVGQDTPAVGFSIGFERIITILKDLLKEQQGIVNGQAYLIDKNVSTEKKMAIFRQAQEDRKNGKIVVIQPMKKNLGHQIEGLENAGYKDIVKVYPEN